LSPDEQIAFLSVKLSDVRLETPADSSLALGVA
jgi:hypothetical protein